MTDNKKPLMGLSLYELKEVAKQLGMPAFTGGQMAKWLYTQHVSQIDDMTNISKANRERLAAEYTIGYMEPIDCQKSKDGTIKYLFPTASGKHVETVYIPDHDRATLCVSSQVGCKMNCLFCQTGKQGYEESLTAADILNQIYALPERDKLTNIVFMGQGEPMDNLDNVLKVTQILTADYGYAWSPKRITVSSVGLHKKLQRFLDESECHVAISMHSPIPEQRAMLMPAERGMSIEEVVELLRNYDFSHQRRLSFEYIMFKGLNDTTTHAREIVKLVKGLDCRFNLIRFHPIPNVDLQGTDDKHIESFRDYLTNHGVFTTIRASRGQDIFAACGLLSTARKSLMTKSGGRPFEVVVYGDEDSVLYHSLTSPIPALPQPEPSFDVTISKNSQPKGADLLMRNIVIVTINPKTFSRTSVKYERDVYAKNQIVIYVGSPSVSQLRKDMTTSSVITDLLTRQEMGVMVATLKDKHNPNMEETIKRMFGIEMLIPSDMKLYKEGKDFVWISNNSPTSMTNICIYTSENRDSVMQKNIKGETDNMYMTTNKESVISSIAKTQDRQVTVRRGLWEMKGDAMGGPFVSHTLHNIAGHKTLTIECFVYAPGTKKRNTLMRTEASLMTVKAAGR